MNYTLIDFLKLLGALGIFIYGMKIMSESIQKIAGDRLRKILSGMTSNRISGIFTGFLTTCLVQSSSATTVMVISFVNAGLLTLSQSLGVVMGANIGTTLTAWIVAYFGFKFKIVGFATILIGLFFPFLFARKSSIKNLAEFVLGFGILFIGLSFLKDAVPDIKENPQILEFLNAYTESGIWSVLLFVFIGTILTIIVQSSSASTAITLVMLSQGWIGFEMAAAMVLGENIGTTITANIAAIIGNVHAKRTARFHSLFNLIGVAWMLTIFSYFVNMTSDVATFLGLDEKLGLALFHTSFNILNVVALIGFVPLLEKFVVKIQPSRGDVDERFQLKFISSGLMATAELSIEQARKEVQLMSRLVEKMYSNIIMLLFKDAKNDEKLIEKIKRREDITDRIEVEIANYLTKLSEQDLSESGSVKVRAMLRMANELERIADIIYQMTVTVERLKSSKTKIPEEVKNELEELFDLVYNFLKQMNNNMDEEVDDKTIKNVYEQENAINNMRDEWQKKHFIRLEKGEYAIKEGISFLNFVNSSEKIGDHIVNINEAFYSMNK